MEVVVAVQSVTLRALRVQLKRKVSARRGGEYNDFGDFKRLMVPVGLVTTCECAQ
jgi:hypothetical protein